MYHSDQIITQLQRNKILALKLDKAVAGVRDKVAEQVHHIGVGATRLLYYTSCFTEEYQDVCQKQRLEDLRFKKGMVHLIEDRNIIYEMLRLYFDLVFKSRTPQQFQHIKQLLMKANVHIAASVLTSQSFTIGVAIAVSLGMNVSAQVSGLAGTIAGGAASIFAIYSIVQSAADSAQRLQALHPAYYQVLYQHELEMMYFLIEPVFIKAGALTGKYLSDEGVAEVIMKMAR